MESLGNLIQVPSQDSDSEGGASERHRGVSPSVKVEMEWTVAIVGNTLSLGLCNVAGWCGVSQRSRDGPPSLFVVLPGYLHTVPPNGCLASRSGAERSKYPNASIPLIARRWLRRDRIWTRLFVKDWHTG